VSLIRAIVSQPFLVVVVFACVFSTPAFANKINTTGRELNLSVPLNVNQQLIGTVLLRIGVDDALTLEAEGLLALLQERLSDNSVKAIQESSVGGRINLTEFSTADITAEFDQRQLALNLELAEAARKLQVLSLRAPVVDSQQLSIPSGFSAYVNTSTRFSNRQRSDVDQGEQAINARIDGAIRLHRPVLVFDYVSEVDPVTDETEFVRQQISVIEDFEQRATRLTMGEVFTLGRSFQTSVNILGFSLGRDYSLSPGRSIRPLGRHRFVLDRKSEIFVEIDGNTLSTLELDAGQYDLRDIPLLDGLNEITLRILDENGNEDSIDFNQLFSNSLLDTDEIDFAFSLGFPEVESNASDKRYEFGELVVSTHASRGWTDSVTLGLTAQGSPLVQQLGIQSLIATRFGLIEFDVSGSRLDSGSVGGATSLRFESVVSDGVDATRLELGLEHQSRSFSGLDRVVEDEDVLEESELITTDDEAFNRQTFAYLSGSRLLTGNLSMTGGFNWSHSDVDNADQYAVVAGLSGQIGHVRGVSWGARLRHRIIDFETDDQRSTDVSLRLAYRPDRTNSVFSQANSDENLVIAGLQRKVRAGSPGGYRVDIDARTSDEIGDELSANFEYTGNRFETTLTHREIRSDTEATLRESSSQLNFETALVFAGGRFAVSRPIEQSFAIIRTHPTLDDRMLRINPDGDNEYARTSIFGPAVVPDLGAYTQRNIQYEVENLPLGYDLGVGLFTVKPNFGAGYALEVGSAATATLIGVLKDRETREPVALVAGKAMKAGSPDDPGIDFFTNRRGKFALSGIAPGDYRLVLNGDSSRVGLITVTEDQGTFIRLDEVFLE